MTQFGKNLNKIMTERGITQKQLSEAVGVSQSRISEWLKKGARPRTVEVENALAKFLGIPFSELIAETTQVEGVTIVGEEVRMSKALFDAKEAEIEYLRKIVTLQNENARLKNIEDVSVSTQLETKS